jgi:hypothetical protein
MSRVYILIPVFENIVDGNEFRGDRRTRAYSQLPFITNTAKRRIVLYCQQRSINRKPLTVRYCSQGPAVRDQAFVKNGMVKKCSQRVWRHEIVIYELHSNSIVFINVNENRAGN